MASMSDMKSRLDAIRREIEKLQAQEALLLDMMGETVPKRASRAAKGSVKTTVLDLLDEVGSSGLNAISAVELAKSKGVELERGSVSSLLSRLKNDNVVAYDGSAYRLRKYTEMPGVTPIRTSGDRSF